MDLYDICGILVLPYLDEQYVIQVVRPNLLRRLFKTKGGRAGEGIRIHFTYNYINLQIYQQTKQKQNDKKLKKKKNLRICE